MPIAGNSTIQHWRLDMTITEYDLNLPSDGFASGGLLTVYDDGKPTVRTVLERCEPGKNGTWHVVDENHEFPRDMLPILLASLNR